MILAGAQEDGGDAFDVGALAGGRGELLAGGEFEAGVADLVALVPGRGPHEHVQAGRPEGAGQVQDPRVAADQQRAGAGGAGDAEPGRATGTAVRPYRATVATMTRKVTGKILDAPPTWLAASVAPKVVAVAAATMPRGAIQPVNARSPLVSSVRMVARKATSGRVTTTRTATRAMVGSTRCRSDAGVTVAEMDTNRTPISCTRVSKNGRLAGTWKTRRFATASPIRTAAMSLAPHLVKHFVQMVGRGTGCGADTLSRVIVL